MNIGIFAKTFVRPTLDETLDAVVAHGLHDIQFNMACAGLPSMPDVISDGQIASIRHSLDSHAMRVAAVSGTFNMIHPDPQVRQDGLRRLDVLAAVCGQLGTKLITLCTGTRDADNMWRAHPDNETPQAWRDLLETSEAALKIAEEYDILLGIEPEVSNVVDSAIKARTLLNVMQSPRLKIVMDGANLFHTGELPRMSAILDEAFQLLGGDLALVHAKDLSHDGDAGHDAAGTGVLDYDRYIRLIRGTGYDGTMILHGLREDQVSESIHFLQKKMGAS
ncbi:MAG: sugar phosphate isomerase/epimerase [Anaerolineae bacterium]